MFAFEMMDFVGWSRECYQRRLIMTVPDMHVPPLYQLPGEWVVCVMGGGGAERGVPQEGGGRGQMVLYWLINAVHVLARYQLQGGWAMYVWGGGRGGGQLMPCWLMVTNAG